MRESDAIESARRALGGQLAEYRRAAGYSQTEFGELVGYSRSSIANVETGRQHVPSHFWVKADEVVHAEGALVALSGETSAAAMREREESAQAMRLYFVGVARDGSGVPGGRLVRGQGDAADVPGQMAGWLDAIGMAAGQAREHAEGAAVTDVGPGTVEQLRADVVRLGRAYVSAPPLPLFVAMHQTLGRVQAALRSRTYPGQARDLNFLAGALCGLMANASLDLGREEAADDLARAAWTHGRVIDNDPLMGWARGTQALAAIWDHRYLDAIRHVQDGLAQLPAGAGTARLHAIHARALAAHGERAQAAAAIAAAGKARSDAPWDDLHDGVGGEFAFDDAKLWYYHALTLADADDPVRAEHAAAVAISLYQGVPARARSYGCEALARVQLARAKLMSRKLDDAADALGGMLSLDPQMRIGQPERIPGNLPRATPYPRLPRIEYRSSARPATRRLQRSQRRPGAAWRAMTIQNETAETAAEFPVAAEAALQDAARRSGIDVRGARLIRLFATAVYHLPAADAVARIAPVTSPDSVTRLNTSVQVTRWLTGIEFPCVEPLPAEQPVTSHGCAVTFWRYLPQDGPEPVPADLGRLLRELHGLGPSPVALPAYRPLVSVRRAIASSRAVDEEERAWLEERCEQLLHAYSRFSFVLPPGMIHGDAYRGNLLRDGQRVVLADWDAVSIGPREVDLIPTLQAARFGLPADQRDAFVAAYGWDIRSWDGYPVLHDIRELSTLTALLRDGHADAAARRELETRLRSLRIDDDQEWTSF